MSETTEKIKTESNFRDPTAAVWPIVRLIVTAAIGYFALESFYDHGFDLRKDGATIGLILTSLGGLDAIKRWIANGEVVAAKPGPAEPGE